MIVINRIAWTNVKYIEDVDIRLSLDKGDPKAYFSGLEILGRLYGLNANRLEIVNKEGLSDNLLNKMRQTPKLDNGDK